MLYCIKGGRLRDHRDRALIALGTAAALRRSELVALRVEDLQHVPKGLRVRIARSKTDRDGAGKVVAVPSGKRIRPVALVDAWLEAASIADGFVFRRFVSRADHLSDLSMDDAGVALVVKRRAAAAGLTAAEFNGRSLRSGFLTAAARAGASIWKMQEVSRHKSVQVFSGCVRSAELFDDHAGSGFLRSEVTDMLAGVGCRNTIWSSAHAASMQPASVVGRLPQCVYLIAGSLALGLHGGNPEISFAVREGSPGMDLSAYRLLKEPFYQERDVEVPIMEAACQQGVPVMLKGPTGCGKTRFVEYIAWRLGRPLITVSCHEDMTAADLVGRHLLTAEGTVWHDGPLTLAVRHGAICYLDEVVEARQDTIVVIHPLGDSRRILPLERKGEVVQAHPAFQLVVSYNPGYQSAVKDLKESTKQRFIAIQFEYPDAADEAAIIARETGVGTADARLLVQAGQASRNLRGQGLEEGASTRMLIHAGRLLAGGLELREALRAGIVLPITDDRDLQDALDAAIVAIGT